MTPAPGGPAGLVAHDATGRTSLGRRVDPILDRVERSLEGVADLVGMWASSGSTPFWWDGYYQVFRTRRSRGTLSGLFGFPPDVRSLVSPRKRVSRLRNAWRLLSRYPLVGPIELGLALPSDAVILPAEPSKKGAAVASRDAGLLLKATYAAEGVRKEVEAWNVAGSAGIQEHVPRLIDHGTTTDGGFWLINEFVPNTVPIDHPMNPLANPGHGWSRWLRWKIMPAMQRFYEASGLEVVTPETWIDAVRDALLREDMPEPLLRVLALAEAACRAGTQGSIITAVLHKDLIPRHLHRHRDRWWLLDWGSTGRGIVCKDYFREYFWRMVPGDPKHQAFWAWLRGDVHSGSLPRHLRMQVTSYLDWHAAWRRTRLDPESLRLHLLLAMLDDYRDVILQYDLKDRLTDTEQVGAFPRLTRTLMPQLRALGVA